MNYSLRFNGVIVELQLQTRSFAAIKEEAHIAYETARTLGLCGTLPGSHEASQVRDASACSRGEKACMAVVR